MTDQNDVHLYKDEHIKDGRVHSQRIMQHWDGVLSTSSTSGSLLIFYISLSILYTVWAGQSSSVPSFWLEITKATPEKNRQRKKWCKVSGNKYQQQFYGIIIIIIVIIIIIILTEEDAPYASLQQYNSSHGMWNLQLITVMWMSENICKTKVNVDFEGDALGPINTFWFTKDIKAKIAFLRQTVF